MDIDIFHHYDKDDMPVKAFVRFSVRYTDEYKDEKILTIVAALTEKEMLSDMDITITVDRQGDESFLHWSNGVQFANWLNDILRKMAKRYKTSNLKDTLKEFDKTRRFTYIGRI